MAGGQRESMRLRRDDNGAGLRPNTYISRDSTIPDANSNGIGDSFTIYNVSATSVTQSVQVTGGPNDTPRFQRVSGTLAASGNAVGTKWQLGSASAQTVVPGNQYGTGVYIKSSAWNVNAVATLSLTYYNASDVSVGSFNATLTPTASWQYLASRGVAPAGAVYVGIFVYAAATGAAGAVTIDSADYRLWQGADPLTTSYDSALRSDFFYIPIELREGQTPLIAMDRSYSKAEITYDPALLPVDSSFGPVLEATIVRSPVGIPQTNLDGAEISRYVVGQPAALLNNGWLSVTDTDLTPGKWYYYGLFAKYFSSGNTLWLRVGEASILMPFDFGYRQRFWSKVPEWYRRMDREGAGSDNTLQRIVQALGYEFDLHRTYASTIGDMWDLDELSSRLLAKRGESLAQPMENAAGDKRYRNLIGNLLFLRKHKGTTAGVEGILTAMTGYKCVSYIGPNIMLTDNDTHALNTVGNWSSAGANHTTVRLVEATGGGLAPPIGQWSIASVSSATTTIIQRLGSLTDMTKNIPVIAGHQYKYATQIMLNPAPTQNLIINFKWIDKTGTLLSTTTSTITNGLTTTWSRRNTTAQTAPANAAFLVLEVTHPTTVATGATLAHWRDIVVDTSWRPTGVPGMSLTEPLSATLAGHYSDTGYWERPRRLWINLYPQRVNLALNSNFELNNLPAGAWIAADVPTYDLIKRAYSDYADILDGAPADGEVDYNDLRTSLNPLSGNWTITFDTANTRMVLDTSVTTAPWYMQASSALFPVHSLSGWSAAAEVSSTHPATKVRLSIRWYSANSTNNPVLDADGNQVATNGGYFTPGTGMTRAELHSAFPPEGAAYGRLLIEATNDVADHTTYVRRVLIDNTPLPGPYFNGSITDGDYGDFFYVNAAHTSYSAYYMSYRSFVTGVGGTDRTTALMTELIAPTRDYKILAANTGLY